MCTSPVSRLVKFQLVELFLFWAQTNLELEHYCWCVASWPDVCYEQIYKGIVFKETVVLRRIRSEESLTFETSAFNFLRWPIYLANSVDKSKFLSAINAFRYRYSLFQNLR